MSAALVGPGQLHFSNNNHMTLGELHLIVSLRTSFKLNNGSRDSASIIFLCKEIRSQLLSVINMNGNYRNNICIP